jgi:lipopolysaccharide transport system permease protein
VVVSLVCFFLAPYRGLVANWTLVLRMTKREIASRVQSTLLGPLWLIFAPLLNLMVYQFVFTVVIRMRWPAPEGYHDSSVLILFAGLTVFSLFGEVISRAPTLVLENVAYVKKVVFHWKFFHGFPCLDRCSMSSSASHYS